MTVRIQLLGPLRAWRDNHELDLGGPQQRAVLGLLATYAATGSVISPAELIDALWEQPPASGNNVIQTYLKRLRRLLEPDRPSHTPSRYLHRTSGGHQLHLAGVELDLVTFHQLVTTAEHAETTGQLPDAAELYRQALDLWKGPPLANVPPVVHHPTVVALTNQRWATVAAYGETMLTLGRPAEALPTLEHAAACCPLDEAAHARLIRAYHHAGRRGQAFTTYHTIRTRLADELGVDPGAELTAAHHALLQDEPPPHPTTSTTTAADTRLPAQLPAATAGFVGRTEQLRQLDKLLAAQPTTGPTIATIVGTAGIGKTTLATTWAHHAKDHFPDGQLFINLRGFDPAGSPVTPAEAIRGLLDALHVPPQTIPTSLDAQVGRYRSLVAGQRMLILLDNARDAEHVRPLLPGTPSCFVLVTSRNQLTGLVAGHGAHTATLEPLPAGDARLALERRIGADRMAGAAEAIDEIVERCGGLPLALAIVAARIVTRPDFPLAAVAADLRGSGRDLDGFDAGDPAANLRAVFSWSYDAVTAPAATLFRLLALHPGPDIGTPAAASLAGVPLRQARQALAELTRAHLLVEHVPGRFRFHDLIRVHATELVDSTDSPDQRRATTHRMLDHYLHTARAASILIDPHRYRVTPDPPSPGVTPEELADRDHALAWFSTERLVLLAAAGCADRAGLDTLAWQVVAAITLFFHRGGHYHDLADIHHIGLRAAQRLADPAMQARAHRWIAVPLHLHGRLDEAHAHLQRSLELSRELDDPTGAAYAHLALSSLLADGQRHREALDHARQALDLLEASGDHTGQARALNVIGWHHGHLGEHQEAIAACRQALGLLAEIGDRHTQGLTWDSIGYAYHQLGDHQQAITCYQQALALLREYGDRLNEAETLDRLGDTYQAIGRSDDAEAAWRDAMTIFDELGHPHVDDVRAKLRDAERAVAR